MIYPEGKPGSLMTDEKIAQLQASFKSGVEKSKASLGSRWLMHPENKVRKIDVRRVLDTIPRFLLKENQ